MRNKALLSALFGSIALASVAGANAATTTDIAFLDNTNTFTVTLKGVVHVASDYSKCADLSAAKIWNGTYWCPKSVGAMTEQQYLALTAPEPEPEPVPTVDIKYLDNTYTYSLTLKGVTYKASDYSKCADLSDATIWKNVYWCKTSVGTLSPEQYTQLTGGSTGGSTGGGTTTPTSYTAKLSWTPPSTRENGTPLAMSELTGYEVYYTSDDLSQSVTVPVSGGSVTTLSVPNLKAGTYHFAISAVDSKGLKSELSSMVSKTLGQ